jgi:hypothetical protein
MVVADHLSQLRADGDGLVASHSKPLDLGLEAGVVSVKDILSVHIA